jgi:translocation and assembly module TamB
LTDTAPQPRRSRWKLYLLLAFVGLLLMAGAGLWYTTTDSFQSYVRRRIVEVLERETGGRVELGAYHTIPLHLQVEIRNLTIHGLEAADQVPLAHVDSVVARIKVVSLLQTQFGFESLVLDHPVLHLIVYPDGSTNQPEPKVPRTSTKSPIDTVFSLDINQFSVRRGEFLWNDQKVPFDINARNFSADMTYSFLRRRFDSHVVFGKVQTALPGVQPFMWTAATHFSLGRTALTVDSLTWDTEHSHVDFHGIVRDFRKPSIQGNYSAKLDLAEAAAILHAPELRGGSVDLEGVGTWSAADFSASGKLTANQVEYRDKKINLRDAGLASDFALDPRALKLQRLQARLLGGSVTGDAEIANWMALASATGPDEKKREERNKNGKPELKKPRIEESSGSIRLRVRDISASSIATAFGTARHFDRLNLDGVTEGTVEIRWRGLPRNLETEFALNLTPPERRDPNRLPINAHARGIYRLAPDELELAQFDVTTRSTQLRASGKLAQDAALQISASSTDIAELQPLITVLGGPDPLPIDVRGNVNFSGNASGKVSAPVLAGHVQLSDFFINIPPIKQGAEQRIHWDALSGDLQLSPGTVALRHASAQRGQTNTHFDVSAVLDNWTFGPDNPFTAHVDLQDADIAELLSLAGYNYPVTGQLNLLAQASGTRAQPHADGHVHLTNAVVYGQPISQFDSDVHWTGQDANFNNIQLASQDARVSGGATYTPATQSFHVNLQGTNLDLRRIPQLEKSRVLIEGNADFSVQGGGTPQAPALNAKVVVHDLTFDHERAGDLNIDAVTEGEMLKLTARSSFDHAKLNLDGSVRLRDDFLADLTLDFDRLDADALLHEYLHGRITGHSSVIGRIQARGPLRNPRQFTATAELTGISTDVSNVKITNKDPIRLTLSNETLRIEQLHLIGQGIDFNGHGTVVLTGTRDLDLSALGHVDLDILQMFDSDLTSSGAVDVNLAVNGTVANPQMQGRVNVDHGAFNYAGLPSGLSDMNGALVFNQNRLQIETLTAHSGGGTLTLTGQATTYAGQISFDVGIIGQDIRLRYPPGVSSTASAELRYSGTTDNSTLSGNITVNKLAITPGFDFSSYASASSQSVVVPPPTSPLYRIKLDVHVTTAPDLQMQTAIARLSGSADLRVRGNAARPAVLGRIDVLEGEISFNGQKYRLERGEVLFTSPVSIQPVLDLQATTRVRDYDITISVNGATDKQLNIKYRSDPPLSDADIIALLAVGQTREESAQLSQSGAGGFSQTASNMILSEALNATVGNRVQRLFGISKIKIDPEGLTTETNPTRGAQVTIEQQISNNFTLTYSQNVAQASQQIILGEYYIRRNLSLVGGRDQNGVVSFDIKIRQRKK